MKRFSDDELSDIQYEDIVEHPYTNAYDLHMGSCDLFALALHEEFGYEMCRIDYPRSFHMFCRTEKEGQIIYIDASGMSSNLQELQPGQKIECKRSITPHYKNTSRRALHREGKSFVLVNQQGDHWAPRHKNLQFCGRGGAFKEAKLLQQATQI